jgi:Ca-activated chloride channel family protein
MDVDTGSYTMTRSYINDGNLPPQDAVRVEEFINYFDQEYPYPPEGKAFAISIDGTPFPFSETEKYQMLRVGIQGYDVPKDQRKDLVLTFVVDSSGSMAEGGRMDLVKRALASLTGELLDSDTVSIVAYSDSARVVLEPTSGGDTGAIMDAIYQLEPMRSTNAEAGLRLGYEMADRAYDPEAANRVVLLSDGVANVGATGPKAIMAEIERFAEDKDITLTSVGVGMGNYNDVLMEQLADQGNGFYAYVDTPEEARRIFEDKLTGSMQTIAQDAKVQVDFNPEVVARYRLIGFENRAVPDSEFREPDAKGGGIGAGHQVTALYEIKLHPDAGGKVATIFLRWKDPETQEVIEIEQPFDSAELAGAYEEAAPRLQWDVAVAELAEVLRGSPWAGENTIAGVLEEAERVARMFPEDEDVSQFVELVRKASQIPQPEE